MNIQIGSAGWSYKDWVGPFYNKKLNANEFLRYYAKYFNFVEVNSTFYNIPAQSTIKHWLNEVPENFKFSIKLWRDITHNRNSGDLEEKINTFISSMQPLKSKISHYLLQFPPNFNYSDTHLNYLNQIIKYFTLETKLVVEFRDNSWFDEYFLNRFFKNNNLVLGTVYLDKVAPIYLKGQNSYYIRLIGDRELSVFDKVQRDLKSIWDHLLKNIRTLKEEVDISDIFIIFNNHFSGFSPQDSIRLMKELNLKHKNFKKQRNLEEYF